MCDFYFGGDNDYIGFMGYRTMCVETVIDEAIAAAEAGASNYSFDRGDFTSDEIEYIKSEVRRRLSR